MEIIKNVRKFGFWFVLIMFTQTLNAQPQLWDWTRQIKSQENVTNTQIETFSNGSVYIAGNFSGKVNIGDKELFSKEGKDIFLCKYDYIGNLQWAKRIGGEGDELVADMAMVKYPNQFSNSKTEKVILGGNFTQSIDFEGKRFQSNGDEDFFITKFDASGNIDTAFHEGGAGKQQIKNVYGRGGDQIAYSGTFEADFYGMHSAKYV